VWFVVYGNEKRLSAHYKTIALPQKGSIPMDAKMMVVGAGKLPTSIESGQDARTTK